MIAIAIACYWQGRSRSLRRAGMVGAASTVLLLGGIISSEGPRILVPARYQVSADSASIEPLGIAAAQWTREWLGRDNVFATDRINRLLLARRSAAARVCAFSARGMKPPSSPDGHRRAMGLTVRSPARWWPAYREDFFPVPVSAARCVGTRADAHRTGALGAAPIPLRFGLYHCAAPGWLKRPLLLVAGVAQKAIEILTGICLPYRATIGPGLYIGHFGNVILHEDVIIGQTCNLSQGVTIGSSGRGPNKAFR